MNMRGNTQTSGDGHLDLATSMLAWRAWLAPTTIRALMGAGNRAFLPSTGIQEGSIYRTQLSRLASLRPHPRSPCGRELLEDEHARHR